MELIQCPQPAGQGSGGATQCGSSRTDWSRRCGLRNISNMAQANVFLESLFLDGTEPAFRVGGGEVGGPAPGGGRHWKREWCWRKCCACRNRRVVGQDWCVRWRNRWLQIAARRMGECVWRAGGCAGEASGFDGRLIVELPGPAPGDVQELGGPAGAAEVRAKQAIVNNRSTGSRRWIIRGIGTRWAGPFRV